MLTTVATEECGAGNALLELRRSITMDGFDLVREFHATDDHPQVRRKVFDALSPYTFRVDATIFEKSKVTPQLRNSPDDFYRTAWYLHIARTAPELVSKVDDLFIAVAQFQTKSRRKRIHEAISDVCERVVDCREQYSAFWPAAIDPCLQIADYCSWTIFRKWESNDLGPYARIQNNVVS